MEEDPLAHEGLEDEWIWAFEEDDQPWEREEKI